jgi:hypothetical protein
VRKRGEEKKAWRSMVVVYRGEEKNRAFNVIQCVFEWRRADARSFWSKSAISGGEKRTGRDIARCP